jgi:O-glycosyl hydrolase
MRKLLTIWIVGVMGFFLFTHVAAAVSLSIDGSQKYQTIDGFGTNINSLSWTNDNSKAAIDLLADQMGQTLWRVVFDMEDWETANDNADANAPDWAYYNALYSNAKFQNLWGTLRYLNQKGFNATIALSFMGRVPGWMGSTTINTSQEDEAVEMIATLVYYARNTEKVQFGMLDPFNETDWDGIEGPQLPSPQYVRLLHKLSVKLDAMGLSDIRLLGPNTASISSGVSNYMPTMMSDAVVMGKVDHFGFHSYSADTGGASTAIKNSAYSGKNFWMTEYANPADAFSFLGQNASAMIVWEGFDSIYNHAIIAGRGSQPGNDDVGYVPLAYNQSTHAYTPRKEFYQNAQLFKFVPPGSVRISATGSTGGLTAYAFITNPQGG